MYEIRNWKMRSAVLALLIAGTVAWALTLGAPVAHAQGPNPPNPLDAGEKLWTIARLALDTLTGNPTAGIDQLYEQTRQSATSFLNSPSADLFFLDFGNPNLSINQFAATVARNLLMLTPLYALGYLFILIFNVWREKPIPNPILFAVLVAGVMIFLAAFAVITQGISEVGRAIANALGGSGNGMFVRATLLDTVLRILVLLQKNGGVLSIIALFIALIEVTIILVQLAYRGISMAVWRLLGVLLIPLSVLLEGVNPKTAGKVLSGFFEAWLDMVGKVTLLLVTLSLAASDAFANYVWFVLPAGLLVVVTSWKFFGIPFSMARDAVARTWRDLVPEGRTEASAELPAAAEAARAQEIDAERRRLLEE